MRYLHLSAIDLKRNTSIDSDFRYQGKCGRRCSHGEGDSRMIQLFKEDGDMPMNNKLRGRYAGKGIRFAYGDLTCLSGNVRRISTK